eukprot:8629446-Lingulodinium_polyedra.AAC.1
MTIPRSACRSRGLWHGCGYGWALESSSGEGRSALGKSGGAGWPTSAAAGGWWLGPCRRPLPTCLTW